MRAGVLRYGVAALTLALLLGAAPVSAGDASAGNARVGVLGESFGTGVYADHDVVVDGLAYRAGKAGLPVESEDGDAVVTIEGKRYALDPSFRPGTIRVDNSALHPVLPDGTTVPAGAAAAPAWLEVGVDSQGRETLSLATLAGAARALQSSSAATGASAIDGAVATTQSSDAGSLGKLPKAVASLIPYFQEPVATKRASSSEGSTVTPSAIAMTPVADNRAVAAAAAGIAAIGTLLALWPLYHRLVGHRTLESKTRKVVYDLVCAKPGVGVAEIAEKAGVSYSTTTYHLDRLVEAGMLVSSSAGAKLRYYKNGGFNETDRALVPVLENKEAMRLLDLIRANPGTYRAALADALNVTTTTVNWHLKRLMAAGLVREERRGRSAHLFAVEERLEATVRPLAERLQSAVA